MISPSFGSEQSFRLLTSSSIYELQDLLGVGGMGRTYLALRRGAEGFTKLVAIKRLLPAFTSDPLFIRSLIEEAKLSALLSHPNIVSVEELGFDKGEYFLVMEYIPGFTFTALLQQEEKLPSELVLFVISEVLQALHYAHNLTDHQHQPLRLIHRDLSPENILLSHQGHVKLADFGLAKNLLSHSFTEPGTIKGKRFYMSPEQAEGGTIDHRADLFSLGVVLLEALLGFRLAASAPQGHLWTLFDEGSLALRAWLKDLPPALVSVLQIALQKQPSSRFQSALQFHSALQPFLQAFSSDDLRSALASWCPSHTSYPKRLRLSSTSSKPLIYVLSQDALFSPEQRNRLTDPFQGADGYKFVFLDRPEDTEAALFSLRRKTSIPLAVIFGGLSSALQHPLLLELQHHPSILRILLLRQMQEEILSLTVSLCGLHACHLTPCDLRLLLPLLQTAQANTTRSPDASTELREQNEEQKKQIFQLQKQNEALSQANLRAATLVQELEEARAALEAKTLFLERLARTVVPSSVSRVESSASRVEPSSASTLASARIFLQGDLANLPLLDLFQLLSMSKKTATVSLKRGPLEGYVVFQRGNLVDASFLQTRGMEAVSEFCLWEEGSFSVHEITRKIQPTIALPTEQVLLEILRRKDESKRPR